VKAANVAGSSIKAVPMAKPNFNGELEEGRGDNFKYFLVTLLLFALLIFAVGHMVGLE